MNTEEFSNAFDVLISSYRQKRETGNEASLDFDEFEKSQFLTNAQEEIVTELYNGTAGFESTEQIRKYLDSLIKYKTVDLTLDSEYLPMNWLKYYKVNLTEAVDKDLMVITYEFVTFDSNEVSCDTKKTVQVTPTRHDELSKIVKNPFRGPSASRVLRVDNGPRELELVSKYPLASYSIGYLVKPTPIILVPLGDLTINGESVAMTSKLDPMLHRVILERAVKLAISSRSSS